jgi:DMSO/TMAO reductase YedYZ molybdopterin-dependent catalytic subunit
MLDALARPTIGQVMHVLGRWFDWNDLPPSLFDKLGLIRFTGEIAQPEVLTIGELKGLQALTQTVTYTSGGAPVTDTFTGVLLTDVIARAGGATTDPTAKNDILAHYVVATGSDGYRAVFSMGEIDPRFGGEQIMLAYDDESGGLGWHGADGRARMVVPGDAAGGRYVSDLVGLTVEAGPEFVAGPGGPSEAFTLDGAVANAARFDEKELQALPSQTLTVTYTSGGVPVTDTYTGVPLWDLLTDAGVPTDPAVKNDILGFYVVATGSDGYRAVFSMGELDPRFGGEPVLVAYDDALGQLGPGGSDGFARMVVPGDTAGGRYVSNLVRLEVVDIDLGPAASDQIWG